MTAFPFNVESPTKVLHRARRKRLIGPTENFATRCGYHVGDWSRDRWGDLIASAERDWKTTKLRVCKRCYP